MTKRSRLCIYLRLEEKEKTKKLMIFGTTTEWRIVIATGMAILASSINLGEAKAQSIPNPQTVLLAQTFGGIERDITLEDVPLPVMAAVRTVTGAEPTRANIEMKPDGSILYELRGQNQQGFEFVVDSTPNGQIIEVDEEIERSAVPEDVIKALKRWEPNASIVSTWRSTRLGEFVYEIVLDNDFWFEIPADTQQITIHQLQRS
ncbi:MAG: hypothetical protein RH949_27340 [Coleofasciculus sp. A1-SPW-01]|uniref:hypothetical protein n=1 Tax=Coleofasciculus TaxID=669368 RepID=UPI001E2945AB|nr:hypothetical protein [Coleofasciculus chthonoplastes]